MAFGDVLIPRFVTVLIYLRLFWVFKHSSSKSRSRIRSRNDRKWITQRKTPACQQKNSQIVFKNTRTISKKPKIKRHKIITSTYEREKIHLVDLTSHFRSIKQFTVGSDIFSLLYLPYFRLYVAFIWNNYKFLRHSCLLNKQLNNRFLSSSLGFHVKTLGKKITQKSAFRRRFCHLFILLVQIYHSIFVLFSCRTFSPLFFICSDDVQSLSFVWLFLFLQL